ncbi:hypothetical protein ABBQ38_011648 [Trebouxia sp. C0009 RCD-2024]
MASPQPAQGRDDRLPALGQIDPTMVMPTADANRVLAEVATWDPADLEGYHTVNRYTLYTIHKHANDVSLEVSRKQHELDELKKQTSSLLAAVHQKRKAKEILTKFKHLRQESGVKYQE